MFQLEYWISSKYRILAECIDWPDLTMPSLPGIFFTKKILVFLDHYFEIWKKWCKKKKFGVQKFGVKQNSVYIKLA